MEGRCGDSRGRRGLEVVVVTDCGVVVPVAAGACARAGGREREGRGGEGTRKDL